MGFWKGKRFNCYTLLVKDNESAMILTYDCPVLDTLKICLSWFYFWNCNFFFFFRNSFTIIVSPTYSPLSSHAKYFVILECKILLLLFFLDKTCLISRRYSSTVSTYQNRYCLLQMSNKLQTYIVFTSSRKSEKETK
jgi:hypothetical protein